MRIKMKQTVFGLVLFGIVFVLAGCTQRYKPVSRWEKSVYTAARKDIYPNDVRASPGQYQDALLVWPGLIRNAVFDERGDTIWVDLTIEHHYYDWLVDATTRKYWLSPKGEGVFSASWPMPKEWGIDNMREAIRAGEMVIVYGRPQSAGGGVVQFGHAEYIRVLPNSVYRTDILEYGRPGEPTKHLKAF